jgi:MFS transporter, DHA2 family, integral membrane protein
VTAISPSIRSIHPRDIHARRWWILAVLCTSLLIVMLGNTALNVALPTLARDLGASASAQQWLVDAYSLVFAGLLFTMSSLGERFGRKGIMQLGLALFGGASIYAGLIANTSGQLIVSRVVMGAAGAMIMPATLSILTNVFPREERAKAVAIWSGVAGGGGAIGMLLSGFLLEHFAWGSVFLVAAPFAAISIAAAAILVPTSRDPDQGSIDVPGAVLSTAGLVTLVYGLIEAPTHGWGSTETIGLVAIGLALLAAFTWWERRAAQPMLDIGLFRKPAFGVSAVALTLVFFTLMGLFFSIAQLFQLVMGYGTFSAALHMAPIALFMMVASPLSPGLVDRFGKRRTVAAGLAIVAVGTAMMAALPSDPSYVAVLVGMGVMAFGMGIAMSPTTDLLMSAVPASKAGMGSATNDTTRELGGALGVAVLGSVMASRYTSEIASSLGALPAPARSAASSSLGGATVAARDLGGTAGEQLLDAARQAWMSGLRLAMIVGAIIIAGAALFAFLALPDRADDDPEFDFDAENDALLFDGVALEPQLAYVDN